MYHSRKAGRQEASSWSHCHRGHPCCCTPCGQPRTLAAWRVWGLGGFGGLTVLCCGARPNTALWPRPAERARCLWAGPPTPLHDPHTPCNPYHPIILLAASGRDPVPKGQPSPLLSGATICNGQERGGAAIVGVAVIEPCSMAPMHGRGPAAVASSSATNGRASRLSCPPSTSPSLPPSLGRRPRCWGRGRLQDPVSARHSSRRGATIGTQLSLRAV